MIKLEFTEDEVRLLKNALDVVSVPGNIAEIFVALRAKIVEVAPKEDDGPAQSK